MPFLDPEYPGMNLASNSLFKLCLEDLHLRPLSSKIEPWYNENLVKIGEDLFSVSFGQDIQKYSISTNQWMNCREKRQEEREGGEAAALNSNIYMIGGWNGFERLKSVEIVDPQSETWTFGKEMIQRRGYAAAAAKNLCDRRLDRRFVWRKKTCQQTGV